MPFLGFISVMCIMSDWHHIRRFICWVYAEEIASLILVTYFEAKTQLKEYLS